LFNELKGYLQDIEAEIVPKRDDVQIVKIPYTMGPEEVAPLVLRWTPSLKLEEGLSVKLKIKGLEVFQADRGNN